MADKMQTLKMYAQSKPSPSEIRLIKELLLGALKQHSHHLHVESPLLQRNNNFMSFQSLLASEQPSEDYDAQLEQFAKLIESKKADHFDLECLKSIDSVSDFN